MFLDRAVGIDLGTTNSEIALLEPSEKDLIVYADRFGRRTIPSAVAWDPKKNDFVVGRAARNRRGQAPGPIESIKRKMGQDATVEVGPHAMRPEEVSAKILEELRDRMREHLAEQAAEGVDIVVERAVITVPAYFDAPQVEATRKAGELAGLEVVGILQEPTAAAIYHTWKQKLGDGIFLVYDLGGGTFDVSILRCLAGEYQVLAIDGDNFLGGDDFDRRFAEHLRKKLVERGYALELDLKNDEQDRLRFLRLVHLAQEIKESLSTSEVVHVSKQGILVDKDGEEVELEAEIGRAEHEEAIRSLVDTTLACCQRALAQAEQSAGIGLSSIDHVVLVGGSTRVPYVIERVTAELCAQSKSTTPLQDEVDTCVALGAAVHAAQIGGLRVGDDKAQVRLTSPLVGRGARLKLALEVERAPDGTSRVALANDEGELGAAELGSVPGAARFEVALGQDPENPARLELQSQSGHALSTLPIAIYRGDVRPRASALSQPSVIAKDIAVEVLRAGRRERKVLLPKGTGLPAEVTHSFFTADRSGAVVLRLLQNRLPIKTLMVPVDKDLPLGTPVHLTLRCDDAMRLEARAEVAGQKLWAGVEPAPQRMPGAEDVEALLARAERVSGELWGRDAAYYRREVEPLMTGIREVLGTDPDKLSALCARLEALLEGFHGGEGETLAPPMHRFEHTLDGLRRTVYRSEGGLLGMSMSQWEEKIGDLMQRGVAAWEAADAGAWRRINNEAQALLETAFEHERVHLKSDDPTYLALRLASLLAYAKDVEHGLSDFVASSAEEVRALQLGERDRLLASLESKVLAPLGTLKVDGGTPAGLRRELDRIGSELERLDAALERLPSIGLVTERGGG